ncbi:brain acid soluble protein 1-like [Brachypodium distachyon]|uniref:brain acid soluble protein 1-like n=1 Tax=Brachypodium distachyon TaxID=15368 RepID=UPI00052FF3A9|nr:brain acid soluble protein 1-like [Brachypodium distachyon]|eukprot:XP_010239166.1 brain acid soluble protein 1-like [Brachypodium distachyon]
MYTGAGDRTQLQHTNLLLGEVQFWPSAPQPRPRKGQEPAADSGKGGLGQASTRAEGSDSDVSSLGVGGDLREDDEDDGDDDAPPATVGVAPEDDEEEDDVPLVRRSAAERVSRQDASPQPQEPHGDVGTGASGGNDAVAVAALTTPATPTAPPARSGPTVRSTLAERVLKLKPAGSSRKRGQTSASPAAPTKKPRPASGGGEQDAADAQGSPIRDRRALARRQVLLVQLSEQFWLLPRLQRCG